MVAGLGASPSGHADEKGGGHAGSGGGYSGPHPRIEAARCTPECLQGGKVSPGEGPLIDSGWLVAT
eukprot:2469035-Pyramimonas_sp.AAC.1